MSTDDDVAMSGTDDEWRPTMGRYEVSRDGRVRNAETGRVLAQAKSNRDYFMVQLNVGGVNHNKTVHRLVALAYLPNPDNLPCVDHIDRDVDHNHVSNLRWATTAQNGANSRKRDATRSRYKGVFPMRGRFYARIYQDHKQTSLGGFATEEEAARAYDAAASERYGEFAGLNFPAAAAV